MGSPLVSRCLFIHCEASIGGAVSARGPAVIQDCVFIGNAVENNEIGGRGGGIAIAHTAPGPVNKLKEIELSDSGFELESAASSPSGGGGGSAGPIKQPSPFALVINCTFHDCSSGKEGGAVFIGNGGKAVLINCTISGNDAEDGSGIWLEGTGEVVVANSIITFSGPGEAISGTGSIAITHSNLFGNAGGDWTGPVAGLLGTDGNISEDPMFVDHVNGDLHLCFGSPCMDAADSSMKFFPGQDFEGDPRIVNGIVDMGADEFCTHLYVTGDTTPGGSIQGKLVGMPGTNPVGLFFGLGVLDPPMPTAWGSFFIQPPWFLIPLVPIPADGVLVLPGTIPTTPPAPYELPMQALIGLEPDSLTNLCVLQVWQ
ncbi:MAG: right-handed parallel beta-helix repeat-containing protein [Planctomycetota bacterium]|jgi:hypothetical protein